MNSDKNPSRAFRHCRRPEQIYSLLVEHDLLLHEPREAPTGFPAHDDERLAKLVGRNVHDEAADIEPAV